MVPPNTFYKIYHLEIFRLFLEIFRLFFIKSNIIYTKENKLEQYFPNFSNQMSLKVVGVVLATPTSTQVPWGDP